jgi:hypothetical protein
MAFWRLRRTAFCRKVTKVAGFAPRDPGSPASAAILPSPARPSGLALSIRLRPGYKRIRTVASAASSKRTVSWDRQHEGFSPEHCPSVDMADYVESIGGPLIDLCGYTSNSGDLRARIRLFAPARRRIPCHELSNQLPGISLTVF